MIRLAPLDRKLVRDLWHLRGQIAAIGLVVASGVAVVVTTRTSYSSLGASRAAYYRDYRFADVFARLKRAPDAVAARLAAVPGVAVVDTRVVTAVTLDVPGLGDPATGRLVSVPDRGRPALNDVHLRRGRWIDPGRPDEVIASEAFSTANHLEVGDTLGAVINGRWQRLRIVGVGISPEYVYEIGEGQLFPDSRRFGVLWMSRTALASAYDLTGAFNDVSFRLAPGAAEPEVIARIDRILAPYGGLDAYGRADQVSAKFLNDELSQNRISGTVVPAIFLGVAAFLLNVVLTRLVGIEREQIGVLKAFGYENRVVAVHYLKLALVALALGAGLGIALGLWFAERVNLNYARFYRFPAFVFHLDWVAVGFALAVTLVAALVGAAGAVGGVVRLPPATAMQAAAPPRFRPGVLERLGLHRLLSPPTRIVARDLERRPLRSLVSVVGIAFAAAILIVGRYFVDAMHTIAVVQFSLVQRENLTVFFNQPRPPETVFAVRALPGVLQAEGFRAVPARLSAGARSRRVPVWGLESRGDMHRLVGAQGRRVTLVPGAIVLTAKLGEVLGIGPGDTVTVEVLEGTRPRRRVVIGGLVDELVGLAGYMDRTSLAALLGEGRNVSGAFLRTDPVALPRLNARLKTLPAVAGVADREATYRSFEATLAESIGIVTAIFVGFAGALAVATVYNSARLSLSERARELASLRVLGFTRGEVARMLLSEQAVLTVLGMGLGLGLGYGLCALFSDLYQWEVFRLPMVVSLATYLNAILVVIGAATASALLIRRRLDRLDLVAVLKTRE